MQHSVTHSSHGQARRQVLSRVATALLLTGLATSSGCASRSRLSHRSGARPESKADPSWSRDLTLYEVNLRQFTPEGTLSAFAEHLPSLKELGVGIVWLMPIHPIGEMNRKGPLGSPYAVRDYLAVSPEFGSMGDLKHVVDEAHALGMHVILDWVANHTAWDNPLAEDHPEWYVHDEKGNFVPPVADWHDVIHLDYENKELRRYMIDAMAFWVREANIDGFRCDVAHMIPVDFWQEARAALDEIKPVFMLAEAEGPEYHDHAFDASYAWELNAIINAVAKGEKSACDIAEHVEQQRKTYPAGSYQMLFTSNHDENSWSGTVDERLGPGAEAFAILTSTLPGIPLIYNGQEAGLSKRLAFFDRDPIEWKEHPRRELYRELVHLKKANPALWHGPDGGNYTRLETPCEEGVLAFARTRGDHEVLVTLNLGDKPHRVELEGDLVAGPYEDALSGRGLALPSHTRIDLAAWSYRVFAR